MIDQTATTTSDVIFGSVEDLENNIEQQATGSFGYNPVATVTCPHCGARLEAIDAKAHVRTSGEYATGARSVADIERTRGF